MSKREKIIVERSPWKLLLWTAVAGLIFGLIGMGELGEDLLRTGRNSLHWHKASGDIVLVKVDDPSLRQVGRWPWPRGKFGELTDALTNAGAKRVFFDFAFKDPTTAAEDLRFAEAIKRSGKVYLAVVATAGPTQRPIAALAPPTAKSPLDQAILPLFRKQAHAGTIGVIYNYQNAVWELPYGVNVGGKWLPSYSALLGNREGKTGTFIPDYSIDPQSVPQVSASSLLSGNFDRNSIRGKDVVIGGTSEQLGDEYFIPGTGKMGGVFLHIIGGETLRSGTPLSLGWVPAFLVALALAFAAAAPRTRKTVTQAVLLGTGALILIFGPAVLEARLIYVDVMPALFVITVIGCALFWRRFRARGLINPVSDLPNLNALRSSPTGRQRSLIATRVFNYDEIIAALPPHAERELIDQIASRFRVGSPDRMLFQGDGGIFAWFEEPNAPFGNHLDALHAMFRNPVRVRGLSIDVAIAFGVEVGSGRSLATRLASALVAAEEAAHQGLKWKVHDPETLENASWRLSMLSQLDEAIDRGEVWVAYQPKLDIATRRIVGAEALARWTHPEKGPIAASEFVAAAEQHNRIGKLTDFVLEKAIAAATRLNKRSDGFNVAVNLSARLLSDRGFTMRLSALLARQGLAPQNLTLELTETAALTDTGEGLDMINRLRDLGVNISIDDYGTGQSTLEYLKKIPANELKIDQSFVKGIVDNRSDRLMVQSTIGLAHSLGRRVVAEGVEHHDILRVLVELDCDFAQGFAVGRPMSLDSLEKHLRVDRKRSAA